MRTSPRSLALVLVSLLLVSLAPAFPVAADNETGNELETSAFGRNQHYTEQFRHLL